MRFSTFLILILASEAAAQPRPTGYVSAFVDYLPNRAGTVELRARAFAEQKVAPSDRLTLTLSAFAEGLLARRGLPPFAEGSQPPFARDSFVRDARVELSEAAADFTLGRIDLLAGFTRVAWGRLDELQPTDVVNPLDVSRFFLEGRSEARLPVALVRGRLFLSDDAAFEAIYLPAFRRGRFDRLDEPSSPFNLVLGAGAGPFDDRRPGVALRNAQGGARFTATIGRFDWSVSAFRGIEPFGFFTAVPVPGIAAPPAAPEPSAALLSTSERPTARIGAAPQPLSTLVREYPRFSMVGADFETVRGEWGIRGEAAAFLRDSFQEPASYTSGRSYDAGLGVDRKAGEYRISGTALMHHEPTRTDVSLVVAADRAFARERYAVRVFGVYGATEGSGFLRAIATAKLTDDVALEGSAGWFAGDGRDLVGRFGGRDFLYARLKVYF